MNKLTREKLNRLILEEINLFLEGEDEGADIFGGDEEEEAADEGGEDTEAAEDTEAEEGDDAEEGGDAPEEEEEEAKAIPEPDLSELPPAERTELSKAVDDEINSLFMDFEANALHSVAVEDEANSALAQESYGDRLKRYLFEGEGESPKIDVHQFANDTARLINNYTDLLDMEQLIYNKAKVFLMSKYTDVDVQDFEEIMSNEHGIDFKGPEHPEPFGDEGKPETPWPPRAVGAQPPAA